MVVILPKTVVPLILKPRKCCVGHEHVGNKVLEDLLHNLKVGEDQLGDEPFYGVHI